MHVTRSSAAMVLTWFAPEYPCISTARVKSVHYEKQTQWTWLPQEQESSYQVTKLKKCKKYEFIFIKSVNHTTCYELWNPSMFWINNYIYFILIYILELLWTHCGLLMLYGISTDEIMDYLSQGNIDLSWLWSSEICVCVFYYKYSW